MNDLEMVRLCLELGVDPNSKDTDGKTVLMYALTLLMYPLEARNIQISQALIAAGANINEFDKDGFLNPLQRAVFHGKVESVRWCLELGADPASKNKYGKTALQIAQQEGHREIENLLKDALTKARQKKIENFLKNFELRSLERFGFIYKAKAAVALFISNYL
jgi:ankyrin repeat protein